MATARRSRAGQPPQAAPSSSVTMQYRPLSELRPYERNPRDNSRAIASVANSIKEFGFIVPIVAGDDGVIVAGHTRYEAARLLGLTEVPVIVANHLSESQLKAFRVIDNKVSELAAWDFDLLATEIQQIQREGLTLQDFGYTNGELDCLNAMVADDCLDEGGLVTHEEQTRLGLLNRRAPSTARFVLGEVTFFIPAADYRAWVDGLRACHDFDEAAIIADIKQRLGIVETAVVAHARAATRRARANRGGPQQ